MLAYRDTCEDWGEPTLREEPTFKGLAPDPDPELDEAEADTLVDSYLWGATRGLDPDRTLPVAIEASPTVPL